MTDILEGFFSYPLFHFGTVGQGVSAAVVDGDVAGCKSERKRYFIRLTFSPSLSTETASSASLQNHGTLCRFPSKATIRAPSNSSRVQHAGSKFSHRINCTVSC